MSDTRIASHVSLHAQAVIRSRSGRAVLAVWHPRVRKARVKHGGINTLDGMLPVPQEETLGSCGGVSEVEATYALKGRARV